MPLRVLAPVARRLRSHRVTHLHVHFATEVALDGMRLSRLLGLPYSVTAHAYEIYQQPRNLAEKLERAAFSTSGCHYTVRDLRALVAAERRGSVHRIIMGVDADAFVRSAPHPVARVVLAVGRLVAKKGFGDLVEACALLGEEVDRLVIVGEGPERVALEAQVSRLGIGERVALLGARSPSEIRAELEAAAVLAMPCVVAADGDRDSMPVVVKEALAMEVPVVCTREVGLPEIVRDEWGRLVPPHDPAALAEGLRSVLALPVEQRMAMGRAGRAFVVEHCNIDTEARKLLALIDGRPRC
jgi:glycosyltransferase involved in cell wall biosynthesis